MEDLAGRLADRGGVQGRKGALGQPRDEVFHVRESTGVDDDRPKLLDAGRIKSRVAESTAENRRLGRRGGLVRGGDQYGALAFAQVVAGRLARLGGISEHPQDVVAQLEDHAQRVAVAGEGVEGSLVGTRGQATHPAGRGHQRRGLAAYINLAIGSGYRGHPLSAAAQDRFYSIRDYTPFSALTSAQYSGLSVIRDSDLTDITATVAPSLSATAKGWKLLLNQPGSSWQGEKVLTEATTLNNQVLFTTYTPGGNAVGLCQPALGVNRFYAVSVIDGSPVANLNNQNNQTVNDRSMTLAQTGIAPNLAFLFPAPTQNTDASGAPVATSTQSNVLCMSGAEMLGSCKSFASRVKTYWKESDVP